MGENNLKLGDLISLEGLEKPMGGLRWELEGKSKKINRLEGKMSHLAGNIENQSDVQVGEVAGLVEGLRKAMIRELSPNKIAVLLPILKERFAAKNRHYKNLEGIRWEDVEEKLLAYPEKLWSLQQMEDTCGEPEVFAYDEKTAEYIFYDCSLESPEGRRNCVYDREGEKDLKERYPNETCDGNAVSRAALMGVNLLTESEYLDLQNSAKFEFDRHSWSWLKTSIDKRKNGLGLYGGRHDGGTVFGGHGNSVYRRDQAFRASLRV